MTKTTFFTFFACIVLTIIVTVVIGRLFSYRTVLPSIPEAGGSTIKVGLPIQDTRTDKEFDATSVILLDTTSNKILFQQNPFERHPIASISKLMTAMVALDHGIPWNQEANIEPEEYVQGGQLILAPGEKVTMKDLFYASLLGSANNATLAYVRQLGIPKDEFVAEMNRKAVELGLEQTEFHDITGLDPSNVSNAYEAALMAKTAFEKYPPIHEATSVREYSFTVLGSGREHTIRNTNKLISENGDVATGSKTGFLYEAAYCLVMQGGGEIGSRMGVILGSPSEEGNFLDMEKLLHLHVQ